MYTLSALVNMPIERVSIEFEKSIFGFKYSPKLVWKESWEWQRVSVALDNEMGEIIVENIENRKFMKLVATLLGRVDEDNIKCLQLEKGTSPTDYIPTISRETYGVHFDKDGFLKER
jgi:hypothetical protein